jgi:hypothetical protein
LPLAEFFVKQTKPAGGGLIFFQLCLKFILKWGKVSIMIDILSDFVPRKDYFERLKPYIGSHIIKILTGQRRVGKSYLLHRS